MIRKEFLKKVGLGTAFIPVRSHFPYLKPGKASFGNSDFILQFHKGAIVSIKRKNDQFDTDYILKGNRMGDILIRYRYDKGTWNVLSTSELADENQLVTEKSIASGKYSAKTGNKDLEILFDYSIEQDILIWSIELVNKKNIPVEIGDVAIPFPMNSEWSWKKEVTYNERVIRHSFISGHNSFMFWTRCNTIGPYLLMLPENDTHLEYYDQSTPNKHGRSIYTAYIHSLVQKKVVEEKGSSWRVPQTGAILKPKGETGSSRKTKFKWLWVDDYNKIRENFFKNNLFDIHITPGMTIPVNEEVLISFWGKPKLNKIDPEFPQESTCRLHSRPEKDRSVYKVIFRKLGENKLTIHYGEGRYLILEFFVTEAIDTLINKRGRFLANRLQIKEQNKWYNDVYSDWNMSDHYLLSPDNLHDIPGSRRYMVTCDDPGLGRPAFLASKNVEYPVQEEVDSLDNYITHFVWGGLQIKDDKSYPYAIYGIPDWKTNRDSSDLGPKGRSHMWRIYDYPHIILMYLSMFRIAKYHKNIQTKETESEYLDRAYQTAMAYYTYPKEVVGWSPYHTGNYNEIAIPELIEELKSEDRNLEAFRLQKQWETKVEYFLSGKADMFGSEYPYDTTGFESTQVFARYALAHAQPNNNDEMPLKVTAEQASEFMQKQIKLNVGCRGWLEKAYYLYGSDYRAGGNAKYTLSYMAQMGGWAILDYAVHFAKKTNEYLRLAYASILSSWALLNSGTENSNYGYWFPGRINDGGAGGGFEPLAYGKTWMEQPHKRGSWYYSSEIDLGFCGFLRAACTILVDDPEFGLTALGGRLKIKKYVYEVIPNDGLRRRFHILKDGHRIHFEIRYDRFVKNKPISLSKGLDSIHFYLENVDYVPHDTTLNISGLPEGAYEIVMDGRRITQFKSVAENQSVLKLPVTKPSHEISITKV